MEFSMRDFFSKCDNADLVTFTEEILSRTLHFFCAVLWLCCGFEFHSIPFLLEAVDYFCKKTPS